MEFLADPAIWIGLATLVVLEIVLGVDNLVFIAILADKLPPEQRDRARVIGLSLALVMRLALLFSISWITTLTQPLFTVGGWPFSGRDLILIGGGAFLIGKATMELHERLEGHSGHKGGNAVHAAFWQVIAQIMVLDLVFSLDSVITAVGMVSELWVMVTAVVVAVGVMILASKPLMAFVLKHPTVVILCLGFLLMIGFSLLIEGFGYHLPKGYLYAAIGFSVLVEAANQLGRRNRENLVAGDDLRARTANAVLRLLGGRADGPALSETVDVLAERTAAQAVFQREEQTMIRGVLDLSARPVRSLMTPRTALEALDVDRPEAELRQRIPGLVHGRVLLVRGGLENFAGVALTRDLLGALAAGRPLDWQALAKEPAVVPEHVSVLAAMELIRAAPVQLALVVDEHGSIDGIVTPTDVFEAIAGEFPEAGGRPNLAERQADGAWLVDGATDVRRLGAMLGRDLTDPGNRYATLGGFVLNRLGRLPVPGDRIDADGLVYAVVTLEGRSVGQVRIAEAQPAAGAAS